MLNTTTNVLLISPGLRSDAIGVSGNSTVAPSEAGHLHGSITRAHRSNTVSFYRCVKIAVLLAVFVIAVGNPTAIAAVAVAAATRSRGIVHFDSPWDERFAPDRFAAFLRDADEITRGGDDNCNELFRREREDARLSGMPGYQQIDRQALAACRDSAVHKVNTFYKTHADILTAYTERECASVLNPASDEVAGDVIYFTARGGVLAQSLNQEQLVAYLRKRYAIIESTNACLVEACDAYKKGAQEQQHLLREGPADRQPYLEYANAVVDVTANREAMQLRHSADECLTSYNENQNKLFRSVNAPWVNAREEL